MARYLQALALGVLLWAGSGASPDTAEAFGDYCAFWDCSCGDKFWCDTPDPGDDCVPEMSAGGAPGAAMVVLGTLFIGLGRRRKKQ